MVSDPSGSGFSWWSEGDDLAFSIVMPKGADAMIDALDGRRPNALENPGRRELAGRVDGFEPIGLGYFDMAALPQLPPQAASLGLDKIKRLDYRWGFQGEALVTVTRLVAPSPRVGIMAMFDGPTFSTKDLPPMPAGVQGFTAFSFDADAFLAKALALATAAEPKAREGFDQAMQMFRQGTGKRLREDVLQQLGPRAISFTVPTRGNLPTNPLIGFAQGVVQVPKTTFMVEVRDPKAFGETLDSLIVKANSAIGQALAGANGGEAPKGVGFVPLKGATKGYSIQMPMGILPLPAGMRPTLILGKKYLILGTTPDVAKRALALENAPPGPIAGPMGEALARDPREDDVPDHQRHPRIAPPRSPGEPPGDHQHDLGRRDRRTLRDDAPGRRDAQRPSRTARRRPLADDRPGARPLPRRPPALPVPVVVRDERR